MSGLKIIGFLISMLFHVYALSMPLYTISEFNIEQLKRPTEQIIVDSAACQVNNLGQIVGICWLKDVQCLKLHCAVYIWERDTGFKVIHLDSNIHKRYPVINDNGIVAWTVSCTQNGNTTFFSYLWDTQNQVIQQLEDKDSIVQAINNRNEILLNHDHQRDTFRKLSLSLVTVDPKEFPVIRSSVRIDLNNFVKNLMSEAKVDRVSSSALNNFSHIVGSYFVAKQSKRRECRGFLWNSLCFEEINACSYSFVDINDFGQIAASKTDSGIIYACLWENGKLNIIQKNARIFAINNNGDMVADMGKFSFGPDEKAFLHTRGVTYELFNLIVDNDSWTSLNLALDINDLGQIVGYGLRNNKVTGFMLNPIKK